MPSEREIKMRELVSEITDLVADHEKVVALASTMTAAALVAVCHECEDDHARQMFDDILREARTADTKAEMARMRKAVQ
jgi:hypothetical protein